MGGEGVNCNFFSSFWHEEQNPAKIFFVVCGLSLGVGGGGCKMLFWHEEQNPAKKNCSLWAVAEAGGGGGGVVNYKLSLWDWDML